MNGYFDHNATTPLSRVAREAYLEASDRFWHNPSSLYRDGAAARRALEDSRVELAEMLCTEPKRVVFNSGATEGSNAIFQHCSGSAAAISAIEHPCVTDAAEAVTQVTVIPCSETGVTDPAAIPKESAIVSVMAANNENGVIQPWREALEFCDEHGIPFHCDASQWLGKLPSRGLGKCGYLSGTAHKFGGPKGTGFLLVPEDHMAMRSLRGGPQENDHRAGTENYPAIASMIAALDHSQSRSGDPSPRDAFEQRVLELIPGTRVAGAGTERLWNTSMLILPEHKNLKWLTRLSARGISVSTGSACSAGRDNPSRVLLAMGYTYDDMSRALRISSGHETSPADWRALALALGETYEELAGGKNSALGKISLTDL